MNGLRKLVLIGGAGTSSDVLSLIASINHIKPTYEVLGLLDDGLPAGSERYGVEVLGPLTESENYQEAWFVDCMGSPKSYRQREDLIHRSGLSQMRFEKLIHPSVFIAEDAQIGAGSILYPNVVILSTVHIGHHVTILSGAVLNHEVQIGDWSILGSGAMLSGAVKVGSTCYLGTGSSVKEGVSIGNGSLVGMGAAVLQDVPPDMVVAGVPARVLRSAE
jgi:sugar O-acyltransferase (sialic acid O-acetyltransferase NeuD family)